MKKINPIVAMLVLFILIVITVFINFNDLLFILPLAIVMICFAKLNYKTIYRYLTLGIFLSIFIFMINYNFNHQFYLAIQESFVLIFKFLMFITFSLIFKNYYSNRDIAYAVSSILGVFKINKTHTYTSMLLILNQIYHMRNDIVQMYKLQVKDKKIKNTIKLIIPFIKLSILKTDQITTSLILKGYSQELNIKLYHNYQTTKFQIFKMIVFMVFYLILILWR